MNHTPTPWKVEPDGFHIQGNAREGIAQIYGFDKPTREANAAYIVLAVNSHQELLEALKGILEIGKRDMSNSKYDGYFEAAKLAIAKAQGDK